MNARFIRYSANICSMSRSISKTRLNTVCDINNNSIPSANDNDNVIVSIFIYASVARSNLSLGPRIGSIRIGQSEKIYSISEKILYIVFCNEIKCVQSVNSKNENQADSISRCMLFVCVCAMRVLKRVHTYIYVECLYRMWNDSTIDLYYTQ